MATVDFTGTPLVGMAPMTVQFTDQSDFTPYDGIWSWTFGDGGTSTTQNPQHTYGAAGVYDVRLSLVEALPQTEVFLNHFETVLGDGSIKSAIGPDVVPVNGAPLGAAAGAFGGVAGYTSATGSGEGTTHLYFSAAPAFSIGSAYWRAEARVMCGDATLGLSIFDFRGGDFALAFASAPTSQNFSYNYYISSTAHLTSGSVGAQGAQFPANQWVWFAVQYDFVAQALAIYVDGALFATLDLTSFQFSGLTVGAATFGGGIGPGLFDEMSFKVFSDPALLYGGSYTVPTMPFEPDDAHAGQPPLTTLTLTKTAYVNAAGYLPGQCFAWPGGLVAR